MFLFDQGVIRDSDNNEVAFLSVDEVWYHDFEGYTCIVIKAKQTPAAMLEVTMCEWTTDAKGWVTGCGVHKVHHMARYCQHCGSIIKEVTP